MANVDAENGFATVPLLSIVVPCYNEEAVLPESLKRLLLVLDRLTEEGRVKPESHLLFVDDGSDDQTWNIIRSARATDSRIQGIKLSGNRGHQIALIAGLFSATGEVVISIDADLQDDLSAIGKMINKYRSGFEIVLGVRKQRNLDTAFKRSSAETYYRLLRALGVNIVFNHADYRLLGRRSLEALKQYREVNLFLRGIVPLLGYRSTTVYYDRGERFAGESKYPLKKMLMLAADGVTSFTAFPLRIISLTGMLASVASVAMLFWVLWIKLFTNNAIPGWASTVVPTYFLGSIQLLSIGVLGEYVAKIYLESKRRPRYFIEESL